MKRTRAKIIMVTKMILDIKKKENERVVRNPYKSLRLDVI